MTLDALVIEDDAAMRKLLDAVLRSRGHSVRAFERGEEAVEAFREKPAQIVLCDMTLPGIDGLEVCRRIRELPQGGRARILACTRRKGARDVQAILEAGADDYLPKPVVLKSLTVRLSVIERTARDLQGAGSTITLLGADEKSRPDGEKTEMAPQRYELLTAIGRGGTSDVYKARDNELGEIVALKLLKPEWSNDESWNARLRQEIKLTRRIKHPNVAMIYELGMLGDRLFLAMEYVPGTTLAGYLEERGRLPTVEACHLIMPVIDGLAAAHGLGIIHRDLKPSNIMVTPEGRSVVLDFGLARRQVDTRLTIQGQIVGTPAYISPEQIQDKATGPPADVYALGCVLYEMLAGSPPFEGATTMSLVYKQISEKPEPLSVRVPGIAKSLESLVMRCLAKNPDDRYEDASKLKKAMEGVAELLERQASQVAKRIRVLIGEPSRADADRMQALLEGFGCVVQRIPDGHDLVQASLDNGADLVILNVSMPRIGGIEAGQILRSFPKTKETPIVLLSERDADRRKAAMIPGKKIFLRKPLSEESLRSSLETMGVLGDAAG